MNNSTISKFDKLVLTSMDGLRNSVPSNAGFLLIGTLTTVFNCLQLITIVKDKKLKTRCYFVIANLSVASATYGLAYVALATKRWARLALNIHEVKTKQECGLEMFVCYFSQSAVVFLPLATSSDRILAAFKPVTYKNMSSAWLLLTVGTCWSLTLIDSGFLFYGTDQLTLVANCNLVSATDLLYIVPNGIEIGVCILVVVCYLTVIKILYDGRDHALASSKTKLQAKVAKALTIESLVHLTTQVAARVGLAALTPVSAEVRVAYTPFIRMLLIVGAGSSLPIFVAINKDFRRAFLCAFPCFLFGKTAVSPLAVSVLSKRGESIVVQNRDKNCWT